MTLSPVEVAFTDPVKLIKATLLTCILLGRYADPLFP